MARRASRTTSAHVEVTTVAIPRKGRPGPARRAVESSRRFRSLVKWRTGSEGRISHLKHAFGFERTVLDGIDGATTWCNWGLLAHNATKIAALAEEKMDTSNLRRDERLRPEPEPLARRRVDHRRLAIWPDRSSSLSASPVAPRHHKRRRRRRDLRPMGRGSRGLSATRGHVHSIGTSRSTVVFPVEVATSQKTARTLTCAVFRQIS